MSSKSNTIANVAEIVSGKAFLNVGIGVAVLAGSLTGLYFLTRNSIKRGSKNTQFDKAIEAGTAQNYAQRINDTWGWFGLYDDEKKLYSILREIPSKRMWEQVQQAYKIMFDTTMSEEFNYRLDAEEKEKALAIINSKN